MQINKTISLAKGEIKISRKDNAVHIEYIGCKKTASTTNKIIEALQPMIDTMFGYNSKPNLLGTFAEAQDNIRYGTSIYSTLVNLKIESCSISSPLVGKLQCNLNKIANQLCNAVSEGKFSYPEKIVLGSIENVGFHTPDLSKYYNPKKLSLSRNLESLETEVNSFNYKKFGLDKSLVTKDFNESVAQVKQDISDFEKLVKEHGDALINWGSNMLSRRSLYGNVRDWLYDYQTELKSKGVKPTEAKISSVQKSRDKADKTQEDYMRIFMGGTTDEAKQMIPHLNLANLKRLLEDPPRSVNKKVRYLRGDLVAAFCNMDDGQNFYTVKRYTPPHSYLFKVVDKCTLTQMTVYKKGEVRLEDILEVSNTRCDYTLVPDSFYDKVLKSLPLKESLNLNDSLSDAVISRLDNQEVVGVLKRMAGISGLFLTVGLEVECEKMPVSIADATMRKLDPTIYPEIKDFLLELRDAGDFDEMVVANKDKEMAEEMIQRDFGRKDVLSKLFTFSEKLQILKDRITSPEKGYYSYNEGGVVESMFSVQEQKEVFKELLMLDNEKVTTYLNQLWVNVEDQKSLAKEYLEILETVPSNYAPITMSMPKKTRLIIVGNCIRGDAYYIGDFTRKELEACGYTVDTIKSVLPSKLTQKELVKFAEEDAAFLKRNLELYSKDYLTIKFQDKTFRKEFIGNRVHRLNRIADNKLTRKLAE